MQEQNKSNNNQHNDLNTNDGNEDQQNQNEFLCATMASSGVCTGACGGPMAGGNGCQGCENGCCTNCGVHCNMLHPSIHGKLCESCHHHWRRTGEKRPISCPYKRMRGERALERQKRKPRNMIMNHDEILALASSQQSSNRNKYLMNVERGIFCALTNIQANKAEISALKKKNLDDGSDETLRAAEPGQRTNSRWTQDDIMMLGQGVRKYGKDFQAIADLLGSKTEAVVRTFYCTHRRRYNLDLQLKRYDAEKEAAASAIAKSAVKNEDVEQVNHNNNTGAIAEITESKKEVLDEQIILKKTADEQGKSAKVNNESSKTTNLLQNNTSNTSCLTSNESISNSTTQKEEIIMEIDSDVEQSEPPPSKKLALAVPNQNHTEASAV